MNASDPDPAAVAQPIVDEALRIFINTVRDYEMLVLDTSGRVVSWNPGAEAIKGYKSDELIGSHFSRFYPQDAIARGLPERELTEAAAHGHFEDEGWRLRKDGSRFWANVILVALRNEQDQLIGYAKVTRDLTDRRQREEALRQSEERFRSLIDGVKDYAIFMLDIDGNVSTWNTGAQQIKGYLPGEIIGSHFSRFYPPETLAQGLPEYELKMARLEGRYEDEGWRLRKDGSRFWANVIITAMRDATGKLMGFSKITRDLTERRSHEEALRRGEEHFRLLVDGVTEYAVVMLDRHGAITSWNSGARRILGYDANEVYGKHFAHFATPEDVTANGPWQQLSRARSEQRAHEEGWRVRKDRTLFWAASTLTALHDAHGDLYGFAMVTQDLTHRRHAESLADTTQRMHEFIAMLAHELRNPLAPIRNAIALMGLKGLKDPTLESMRLTIDRQSAHLSRLLDELLDVNRIARGQFSIERHPVSLTDVITRAIESSRPLIDGRRHRLVVDWPSEPHIVLGDDVRLTQAFVNLLNNAAKYTPDGGLITVSTRVGPTDFEVTVRDTGRGIAKEELERVFDLFVQIEPNSQHALGGLGVGLALVRRVVELHSGSVQARSDGLGKGSEFIVRLPRPPSAPRVVDDATIARHAAVRRLRVMVVDDSRDAADSLQLLLKDMGQDARAVYDGPSALRLAESFKPELVFLDIAMPEMSGYQVARALLATTPSPAPVLVAVTGWGQDSDRAEATSAGFVYHFVKPVDDGTIRSVVEEVGKKKASQDRG